jgi:hypothetical protein
VETKGRKAQKLRKKERYSQPGLSMKKTAALLDLEYSAVRKINIGI